MQKRSIKSTRIPIQISAKVYEKIRTYSELTGVTIQAACDRALEQWFDTVGAVHIEVLTGRVNDKVLLAYAYPEGEQPSVGSKPA